jgi:hypothetical protein
VYEELFYVGPEGQLENQVKLQLDQENLAYDWNNHHYQLELPMTVMEESIYLRNHISKPLFYFSRLCNKINPWN